MKAREWFLVIFIILLGIICLTISATHMLGPEPMHTYFFTFIHLCLLMGVPLLLVGLVYLLLLLKEKKKGTKE
ncbi:hypothetical protein [Pseudalkalibacillus sp. SCS-8]|uniref:hypothetical protein n=1 Tax=Pseudalkalibacillus nanhaiensis TaxID=3115291 RepID=UPI0032D9D335